MLRILGATMALLFCQNAAALPRVYKLDLSYERILHNSDPMVMDIPHKGWSDAVSIETGVTAGRWYLDANPHFESAYSKVTTVGLLFHTGFALTDWLDLDWMHHSRHSSDRINTYDGNPSPQSARYPLFDSYGLVVHFIPGGRGTR